MFAHAVVLGAVVAEEVEVVRLVVVVAAGNAVLQGLRHEKEREERGSVPLKRN